VWLGECILWQFSKFYFPDSHIKVVRAILKLIEEGTVVYYITGNHDEKLRKFTNLYLGKLIVTDKLVMNIDGKNAWFFHGDIFDVSMKHAKWLAKLGGKGYDLLIVMNKVINYFSLRMGRGRVTFSKRVKDSVKKAISFINDFESTVLELALNQNYDYVICGHIHSPVIRKVTFGDQSVTYMNSGDWIENLTALEYENKAWQIYKHHEVLKTAPSTNRINTTPLTISNVKPAEVIVSEYLMNQI
jgi:UDP-2,3-diacylglucosamine pyrophosphatase LpxH